MTSIDAKALAAFVALLVAAVSIMIESSIDNRPWPTAQQALSWSELPCVETETYQEEYTYNPYVSGGKHEYYDETRYRKARRCKVRAQIGPVFPKACIELSIWSGLYPMSRRNCTAKQRVGRQVGLGVIKRASSDIGGTLSGFGALAGGTPRFLRVAGLLDGEDEKAKGENSQPYRRDKQPEGIVLQLLRGLRQALIKGGFLALFAPLVLGCAFAANGGRRLYYSGISGTLWLGAGLGLAWLTCALVALVAIDP